MTALVSGGRDPSTGVTACCSTTTEHICRIGGDSIFGLSRQMTRNPKTRMENIKKNTKKADGKHRVFNFFFFFNKFSAKNTHGCKKSKKCGWWRGCRTGKKRLLFVKQFCGCAPTQFFRAALLTVFESSLTFWPRNSARNSACRCVSPASYSRPCSVQLKVRHATPIS